MKAAAVRILRALHTALDRWLSVADQPVVKGKTNHRGSDKPRARRAKRADLRTADPTTERKPGSWFDCDPETLHAALPRDPDEEEAEALDRAHFRNWPGRR